MTRVLSTRPHYTARPGLNAGAWCALLFALVLAACAQGPLASRRDRPSGRTAHPFDPVLLRIHALTHVDPAGPKNSPDQCLLVLHLELKDAYDDTVKGLGPLTVELFRPGGGPTPGIETQALVWDVPDFADPTSNSSRFDAATHTYRLPLQAPRWVDEALTHTAGAQTPAWLKVRATLTVRDAEGRLVLLADEFVIQQ
ncbi:MAG: hypothetical protein HBSAPP03_24500 [Phycisphaerae bacterium]|nr:MAG: hypothetical protein HBSAPP03_24500 [Phycisphaerae bacterium]